MRAEGMLLRRKRRHQIINNTPKDSENLSKNLFQNFKKSVNDGEIYKSQNCQCNINFVAVTAEPELLQGVPKIFKSQNLLIKNEKFKSRASFLGNILSNDMSWSSQRDALNFAPVRPELDKSARDAVHTFVKSDENMVRVSGPSQTGKHIEKNKIKGSEIKLRKRPKIKLVPFSESDQLSNHEEYVTSLGALSYADFYEVPKQNAFIFHLHHPCKFSFHGEIKLTLIFGEVEILGLSLCESSKIKSVLAYSPELYTPLVVESKSGGPSWKDNLTEVLKQTLGDLLPVEKVKFLLKHLKPNDAILLIEQVKSGFGMAINQFMNLSLFPKNLENLSSATESLKKLQSTFRFDLSNAKKEFRKNEEWNKISLQKCTVLCGGKGVGKSTLLKYFINGLISENEKVLVLDFDPGQPEFTPPGFVSATVVSEPLLGPNFTHVIEGDIKVYFGGVNTTQSPSKYLDCVDYVIQECKKDPELVNYKWLVNTMGFCKGLGVELMISVLKLLNPDTVVQIKSSNALNNYPFSLTPEAVNKKRGFAVLPSESDLFFDFVSINSFAEIRKKQIKSDLTSAELRKVMMLSYLSQMLGPPYHNFNGVEPYVVPISNVYLGIDFFIEPRDILKSFNGNLVSFSRFKRTTEIIFSGTLEGNDNVKIVLKPKVTSSLGLGFIRGIDCRKRKLYIITHLPLEKLRDVNCLSLGKISPPDFLFLKQDTVRKETVYTGHSNGQATKRVKRLFRKLT